MSKMKLHEAVEEPPFPFRYCDVRGVRYLRLEDVVEFLRELGSTEETDVRKRLNEAASRIMGAVSP